MGDRQFRVIWLFHEPFHSQGIVATAEILYRDSNSNNFITVVA